MQRWLSSMPCSGFRRSGLLLLLVLGLSRSAVAQGQIFPFTSGPIPPCDTSTFTADAWGIGTLYPPGWGGWGSFSLVGVQINITTDHPEFLQIILTSPQGTSLLLSAFNGAGGQNYTSTNFIYGGWNDITTGSAPFTGTWAPQGGDFDVFDYENGSGTWTITVIDTACATPGGGPGGGVGWNPGWFDGSSNNGGFTIAFNGPPPCMGGIPYGSATLCPGETVDMVNYYESVMTGYSYTYYMPDGWTPVPDPTAVSAPGQYYIQAYDPWDGCAYNAMYDVLSVPQIVLGPDQNLNVCSDAGPVNLAAQFPLTGWETQSWAFNGATISAATAYTASTSGVYQLIASNSGSCGDTAIVTLNIEPLPVLGPDQALDVCTGSSIDLTVFFNTAGLTVQWYLNGSSIPPPIAATEPGTYMLQATTPSWCTAQAYVTLAEALAPSLGADQSIDLCDNALLDLTSLFNTNVLNTAWTFGGVPLADPTAISAIGTYQLEVANASGCSDVALVTVNAIAAPALGPDVSAGACSGNSVDLTAQYNTSGLITAWTQAGLTVPLPTAVTVTGAYTVVAMNVSGCADTANVNVSIAANPVLGADQALTECTGTVVDLTTLYATGASTTAWTEGGVPVVDPTAVTSSGSYTLTATNAAGCTTSAVVTLSLDPAPTLGADQQAAICAGSTHDLTTAFVTTGLSASWTLSGSSVADAVAVGVAGAYQLVVSNGFGCNDTAVVMLTVNPDPSLGPDRSFALCPWHHVDLSAVFPVAGMSATYTMDGLAVDSFAAVVDSGAYTVRITDVNGCTDEATALVTNVECVCEADFVAEGRCIQDQASFSLQADSVVLGAQWDFGGAADATDELAPDVIFAAEGEVLVTLQATLSCGVVTMQRTILMYDCSDSCSVWIPSAFTPDGDDRNDAWTWVGECDPDEFLLMIFDRWGELIFSTEDPLAKWDGTYQGVLAQDGVYVYRVGYRLPYQKRKEVIGHVTLLR